MRIIIKPLGAALLIATIGFLAYRTVILQRTVIKDIPDPVSIKPIGGVLIGQTVDPQKTQRLDAGKTTAWVNWGGDQQIDTKEFDLAVISFDPTGKETGYALKSEPYDNDPRTLTWKNGDGTMIESRRGVRISQLNGGFLLTVPADKSERTLTFHTGGMNSSAKFVARLSDGSAPIYSGRTRFRNGVYTQSIVCSYHAKSNGQTLSVTWVKASGKGYVSVNGASLENGRRIQQSPLPTASIIVPTITIHEAENPVNTVGGGTQIQPYGCNWLGKGGYITFNNVKVISGGTKSVAVTYSNPHGATQSFKISVNGDKPVVLPCPPTPDNALVFATVNVDLPLSTGTNTIKFHNDKSQAPDLDKIVIQ